MNSSAITMSAQCQPISNIVKTSQNNEHNEQNRTEIKHRNRAHHQNAWTYITNRILGIIHKTFKKEEKYDEFELMLNEACAQRIAQKNGPQNQIRRSRKELERLSKKTNFKKEEVKLLYWGYKCATAMSDGILNESIFKDIYSQFFPQAGDASLYAHYVFNAMFSEAIKKNSGQITFSDYACALSLLCRGSVVDKVQWIFTLYDINKDGRITIDELVEISIAIYALLGCNVSPAYDLKTCEEHAKKVFSKLDVHNNGYITFEQFLEICLKDETILQSMQSLDTTGLQ